jgi:hypothetical protein
LRPRPVAAAALLVSLLAVAAACAEVEDRASSRSAGLSAQTVTLEVPAGDRTLRAFADKLELVDGGDEIVLSGDARIDLSGPGRIEARADRLRLISNGPVVELEGGVRAVFALRDEGVGDAGL